MTVREVWSGVVNVLKPPGLTSRDAVDAVQRLLPRPRPKIGHAGTLDPLATGVLVVCLGAATRLVPYLQDQRKRYRGTFRLGESSSTDDVTGEITVSDPSPQVSESALREALTHFLGTIKQVPPRVSAVHVGGQRAYHLARKGVEFELAAKEVEVDSIHLEAFDGREFTVDIVCGGGTYVRSIGRDVGQLLGCGALMTALVRTAVGPYTLETATSLERLAADRLPAAIQPGLTAVAHLPRVLVTAEETQRIRCGQIVPLTTAETAFTTETEVAAVDGEGSLVALGKLRIPGTLFAPHMVYRT